MQHHGQQHGNLAISNQTKRVLKKLLTYKTAFKSKFHEIKTFLKKNP